MNYNMLYILDITYWNITLVIQIRIVIQLTCVTCVTQIRIIIHALVRVCANRIYNVAMRFR